MRSNPSCIKWLESLEDPYEVSLTEAWFAGYTQCEKDMADRRCGDCDNCIVDQYNDNPMYTCKKLEWSILDADFSCRYWKAKE